MKLLDTSKKADYKWFALFAACTIGYSLVQDVIRPEYIGSNQSLIYLLGVMPNFFSAIGLPAIFMILIPYLTTQPYNSGKTKQNLHLVCLSVSATGLTLWEIMQLNTPYGYFDWHDLIWTYIGSGCFYLMWLLANSGSYRVIVLRSENERQIEL